MKNILQYFRIIKEILKLEKIIIAFKDWDIETKKDYEKTYSYFTKPHRLKLFKNKTLGVELIPLNGYNSFAEYYNQINGKNSAAYYQRKALRKGYKFVEINLNDYIDDIYQINISTPVRQGKAMSSKYLKKESHYEIKKNFRYFGCLNSDGILLSYCCVGFYGEFANINVLLGHYKFLNDGIMYLMMVELNKIIFNEYKNFGYKFIMYDMFFGASDGLKMFKRKLGYKPYRVKWLWND